MQDGVRRCGLQPLQIAEYHTYFVGCQEWGFSVWAHNASIYLYRYHEGGSPEQMRHWSIEVDSDASGSRNSDLGNDTKGQPGTTGSAYPDTLQGWLDWANTMKPKPKAWVRKLSYTGKSANKTENGGATLRVTEAQAKAAIDEVDRLFGVSGPQNKTWNWSLNGESCFEYVAKILRAADKARPPGNASLGIPNSPTSDATREALLTALNKLNGRHDT